MQVVHFINAWVIIRVGPWQCKVSWPNGGRYAGGSRWHSKIHRWADEPDY